MRTAYARLQPPELFMPQRHIQTQKADAAAMRAIGLAEQGRGAHFIRGIRRTRSWCIFQNRVERLADSFVHAFLLLSNVSKSLHNISSCVCYSSRLFRSHPRAIHLNTMLRHLSTHLRSTSSGDRYSLHTTETHLGVPMAAMILFL